MLRIRGDCMIPQLVDGDRVAVSARRLYLPGDVLVFRTPAGDLAAHRLVGWRPAGLVTKGDGCALHDAPVRRREIAGAANLAIPLQTRLRALGSFACIVARRVARRRAND
jgi:hypothetical protein